MPVNKQVAKEVAISRGKYDHTVGNQLSIQRKHFVHTEVSVYLDHYFWREKCWLKYMKTVVCQVFKMQFICLI